MTPELETELRENTAGQQDAKRGDTSRIYWLTLLMIVAKRSRPILIAVAATTLATIIGVFFLPNMYTARTVILPPQQNQSLLPMVMGQLSALSGMTGRELGVKSPADLYAAILQSETIKTELVRQFALLQVYDEARMVDARKKLSGRTDVAVRTKEGLIDLAVEDRDPKRAADLANAYVHELFRVNERLALTEAAQRRVFFERELQKTKEALTQAEDRMKAVQQSTGILQVETQAKGIIEAISSMGAQVAAKEVQLRALRMGGTDQNPAVQMAEEELVGLKNQLVKLKSQGGGAGDPLIATRKLPETSLEYIRSFRDLKYQETLFELLSKQFEAARIDEAKSAPVIQVVDVATPPEKKSGPARALLVIVGATLSVCFAIFLAICREALDRFLQDPANRVCLELAKSYVVGHSKTQ